ncbi:peptidase G1 [Boletus coccyginus]|nr:peptidase G1 [Boletus coccyginus]
MLFSSALFSSFLLASAVLADRRRERRQFGSLNRVKQPTHAASDTVQYTTNWAGAVWNEEDGAFTSVTGTFTVPVPSGNVWSAASAWVGIDGDGCSGAGILQTGIDFTLSDNGPTYGAWYEWYPDTSYYFSDFDISAGDVIRATVNVSSPTSGTAMLENLTNGQTGFTQLNSTYPLCQQNAEWIVEDFQGSDGNMVSLTNFGTVTFTDAVAIGKKTYTPDGASVCDISQDQVLTSVSVDGSSVTIKHV